MKMKETKIQPSIEELRVTVPSIGIAQKVIRNERSSSSLSESSGSVDNLGKSVN